MRQGFLFQSVLNFSAQVFLGVLTFLLSMLLARWLGPGANGAYSLAVLLATLLFQIGNLGLGASAVYFSSNRRYVPGIIAGSSIAFCAALTVLIGLGIAAISQLSFIETFLRTSHLSGWQITLSVMTVPLSTCALLLSGIALGLGKVIAYNSVSIVRLVVQVVLVVAFFASGRLDLDRAILSFFAAAVAAAIQSLALLFPSTRRQFGVSAEFFHVAFRYGVKAYIGTLIQFLGYRISVLLVAYFLGVRSVGYYAVALAVAEGLWLVGGSVGQILFPRIASLEEARGTELTLRATRGVLAVVVMLTLGIAALATPLVSGLFGPSYLPAVPVVLWLMPGVVLLSIPKVLSYDLAGRGHPELGTTSAIASLAVSFPLYLLLIPRLELVGAALATSAGYAAAALVVLVAFARLTGAGWLDVFALTSDDIRLYVRLVTRLLRPFANP